jgi:hypothetical protein
MGSCQLTFHSLMTVQSFTSQLFGFDTSRIDRLITDWSVGNMNPHFTPYRMLFNVNLMYSPKNKIQ